MGFFADWNKIMESANDDVVDWVEAKASKYIKRFLNDKATQNDLKTLIDECDGVLRDQHGQKTYYEFLDRYVNNGRIRRDIGGDVITSGFYSTLISVFVYCDDRCRGVENFADYHLNKMKEIYPCTRFDENDVKSFFLYCYNAFKTKFATPSNEDRAVVNAIKETVVNQVYAATQDFRDENRRTREMIEHDFNEIHSQNDKAKNETIMSQELLKTRIHDDNEEYKELHRDTLFLEAELNDNKKATLRDTYVEPCITSKEYYSLNLDFDERNFDLDKWIYDRDSRILLLYGKAGIGKTSFVARLAFEHWLERDCHVLKLRDYIGILRSNEPWESIKECFKCENDIFYENAVLILDGLDEVCVLNREFDGHKFVENLSRTLRTGIGRYIRVVVTSRMGYYNDIMQDLYVKKAMIAWDETSVCKWCDSYCSIHTSRIDWCNSFKNEYSKLAENDKRRDVFCSPLILYMCCVSQIDISSHNSVASIYDESFRVIATKEYHVMNEEAEKEVEINRQFTKEIAFQMFLNSKLEDALCSDWVNIAKEKTVQWGKEKYGIEDIKPELKKIFALNHFAFKKKRCCGVCT